MSEPAAVRATHEAVEAVFRMESARLYAGLARWTGDLGRAEDLAQAALLAALEQWPREGVPRRPGAWLMATAKRRAIDGWRREALHARKRPALEAEAAATASPDLDRALDEDLGDDLLRLIFVCCHPALSPEARVALTLRLLCGLSTAEIARAFLVSEPTVAQRLVRAKRLLAERKVPFEVPTGEDRAARLGSVLDVIYLVFNEGYVATSGARWLRQELCEEALRLARVLAARLPQEPEVHGLLALLELQGSRARARVGPDGAPVLLLDQDRARWDHAQIQRGLLALERALSLGTAPGPRALQAAIAACHARARRPEDTDWARIVRLYERLLALNPSPVVALNHAVALSMAEGPAAGLARVDALVKEGSLAGYALLPGVRGDLLARLGHHAEAKAEFERAAALTANEAERGLLLARAAAQVSACEP